VWITPEDGRVPGEISSVRERIDRPVKGPALFDAIMQAVVGSSPGQGERPPPPAWPRRLRVLVADDHDVNQMVVRDLLQSMGLDVDLVSDGEGAVAAALTTPYDVVLMDCQMPVVDGLEATRRIRLAQEQRRIAHAPWIIALTANATAEDRQACLAAGMNAYLTKPVRGTVLQRTLLRLVVGDAGKTADEEDVPMTPAAAPAASLHEPRLGEAPDAEDILDPADVLLRCNYNADLGAQMLQLFAESLPGELEALEAAAAANDRDRLGRITHKMRGAAATLAAVRLAGAITGIELFLKYGDGGPLPELLAEVRHESALFIGVVPQTVRRLTEGTAPSRQG
jgi:CheY-like chemotaxis protein